MVAIEPRATSSASMLRSPRLLLLSLIILGAFTFIYTRSQYHIPSLPHSVLPSSLDVNAPSTTSTQGKPPAGSSADVRNTTLGFERVFVINLPERHDKLDAFSLAASLTDFTYDVVNGIRGDTVVNKTLPALDGLPVGSRIVRDRISTALVLEDDSDWDVRFKDQLADFATGSRYISGTSTKPRSPYGDDWDLLWLGHCSAQQNPSDQRRFVIQNDDTVPPINHRINFNTVPDLTQLGYDNSTRIVFRANDGVCLYSYALSYRGAQKVLRWQNNVKKFHPIDIGIGYQCRDDPNFKCIAVFPQMVDSHKAAGRQSRDSDIGSYDPNQVREKGYTYNIVRSTRLNIDNLMTPGPNMALEDQWTDLPQMTGPRRTRFD
ncbi:MAG: hypothetical protein Q9222_003407 [Ikaeria aurantiellina]